MQYQNGTTMVNSSGITGQLIAHSVPRLSAVKRAFGAADVVRAGQLTKPTVTQAAMVWHVSATYVHHALARFDERSLIEQGFRALVPPITAKQPALPMSAPIGDLDLVALATSVGPDRWLAAAARAGI